MWAGVSRLRVTRVMMTCGLRVPLASRSDQAGSCSARPGRRVERGGKRAAGQGQRAWAGSMSVTVEACGSARWTRRAAVRAVRRAVRGRGCVAGPAGEQCPLGADLEHGSRERGLRPEGQRPGRVGQDDPAAPGPGEEPPQDVGPLVACGGARARKTSRSAVVISAHPVTGWRVSGARRGHAGRAAWCPRVMSLRVCRPGACAAVLLAHLGLVVLRRRPRRSGAAMASTAAARGGPRPRRWSVGGSAIRGW